MTAPTYPRPVLSERQRDMLASLGLTWDVTPYCVFVYHEDLTFTRVDAAMFDIWLDGFLKGRSK